MSWPKKFAVVLVIGGIALTALFFIVRGYLPNSRVDRDGGPVPAWLPAATTDLHIRGEQVCFWFSGRCPAEAITHWAEEKKIPLKERRHGEVVVIDFGKLPIWTEPFFHRDESLQTLVPDTEELIYEQRAADGGGITVHYVPSLQVFHGDRSWW